MTTISTLDLIDVTGGAARENAEGRLADYDRRLAQLGKKAAGPAVVTVPAPAPSIHAAPPPVRSFCDREPFACANAAHGGDI